MGFLDKVFKDVEKGVGKAQFEADKMMKVNSLRGEIEKQKRAQREVLTKIGEEVVALQAAGQISLPTLEAEITQHREISEQIAAKETELEAVQKAEYAPRADQEQLDNVSEMAEEEVEVQGPDPATMAAPQAGDDTPSTEQGKRCAQCGSSVPEGAAFCAECGSRVE